MKKLFLTLAMTMVIGSVATVFAADEIKELENDTGKTVVKYEMEQSYTITIPVDFNLKAGEAVSREVSASNVFIGHGKVLKVKVASENATGSEWYVLDNGTDRSNQLKYSIDIGGTPVSDEGVVLSVDAGNSEGNATMNFKLIDEVKKAGTYSDTLTFTASVE